MRKVLLLNSGGFDSATLAKKLYDDGDYVVSLFVNSGQLGWEEQLLAAEETADRYCEEHFVVNIDWGFLPNHYEDYDGNFAMYDFADEPFGYLHSGPPNLGFVLASIGAGFAKAYGCEVVVGGFKKNMEQGLAYHYNELNTMRGASHRSRVDLEIPIGDLGAMDKEEQLERTGAQDEDFTYTARSVPEEVD